ncbi:MAG: hypothetical protein AAGF79_14870 [Pseudomonadota bacterium]
MADKKDENQGTEVPEDASPSQGRPEDQADGTPSKEETADIVDAEFEEISDGDTPEETVPDDAPSEPVEETAADDTIPDDMGEDAPVDPEDTGETDAGPDDGSDDSDPVADEPPAEEATDDTGDDVADADRAPDTDPWSGTEPDPAPEPEPAAAVADTPTETIVEKTIVKKAGFMPLFLGGIVAALLGFIVARVGLPEGIESALPASMQDRDFSEPIAALQDASTAQGGQLTETGQQVTELSSKLDDLTGQISDVGDRLGALQIPDTSPLESGLADLKSALETAKSDLGTAIDSASTTVQQGVDDLTSRLNSLDVRVSNLEKRPIAENLSDDAIAAYERELDGVRRALSDERDTIQQAFSELLDDQKAQMSSIVDQERGRIDDLVAKAQGMVDDAQTVADQTAQVQADANRTQQVAAAQSAIALIQTALNDGQPFGDQLEPITEAGVDVPGALTDASTDGVVTQGMLLQEFPPAARAALTADREADPDSTKGIGGFFERQLGARSTTPQEGTDTDAILSRAEAAVKGDDLSTALSELQALPAPAAEQMASWVQQATTRRDALAALTTVSTDLNSN